MRRLLLVMTVAAVMAAVMVVSALPVLADPPPNKRGQFTCYAWDPNIGFSTSATNVPQGQVANYTYGDPNNYTEPWGACYRNS